MIATLAIKKYKLQQWTEFIHECRTSGLTVEAWCAQNGFSKNKYYYRLRKVREAMLLAQNTQEIVPISEVLVKHEAVTELPPKTNGELKIQIGDTVIHVYDSTPESLLEMALKVVHHAH